VTDATGHCSFCGASSGPFAKVEGLFTVLICIPCLEVRQAGPPDQQRQPGQQPRPGAEDILAERLARGEIDPEEYRQHLQTLQEITSRPTPPLR
jgi:uncharacterized membrane protein